MPSLRHKTILLISPQAWGKMFLSKHHYAIELARRGNKVYFLTPLDELKESKSRKIIIQESGFENLFFIESKLFFPFQLKFHAVWLFNQLMKIQLKRILKKIHEPIDIVWSFDLGNFFPLTFFDKPPLKIFHPVDEPLNKAAIDSSKGANMILSVTNEIIAKYHQQNIPKYFINHGINEEFFEEFFDGELNKRHLHVGLSGNHTRSDIDWPTLLSIVTGHPIITFEFWGPYETNQSNLGGGGDDKVVIEYLNQLKQLPNVLMHGAVKTSQLAKGLANMDAFLICYNIKKDQSNGTNYHKIMEYLSTGKIIISNNVTTYQKHPSLIQMTAEREDNNLLPTLFQKVINNLEYYNSKKFREERISFAKDNTYSKQLDKIESFLENNS